MLRDGGGSPGSQGMLRRQAEDGTMVGGGAEDRSGGGRRVARRKTHRKAEDASGAEVESETEGIRGFPLQEAVEWTGSGVALDAEDILAVTNMPLSFVLPGQFLFL